MRDDTNDFPLTEGELLRRQEVALMTFETLYALKLGTRLWWETLSSGGAFMVLRGALALHAYLGMPRDNPLEAVAYDEILAASTRELRVHGGFNIGLFGDDSFWPAGYYWIGWDYGHWNDRTFIDFEPYKIGVPQEPGIPLRERERHGWTVLEVVADSRPAIVAFDAALTEWNAGRRMVKGGD
jgi:hypothetical protein